MPEKKPKANKIEETETVYCKKPVIRFFNSVAEQREEMYQYWASITPEQRMINMTEIIIMAFGLTPEKLENPGLINKIRIIRG